MERIRAISGTESVNAEIKSEKLLTSPSCRSTLAKSLSAFANSGGGTLILGAEDDGTITGVDPVHRGRTRTRDWLEQLIPSLLQPALTRFNVCELPTGRGKPVVIIEISDSPTAPHQSSQDHHYYCRQGGRSVPAEHFFLELLRERRQSPILDITDIYLEGNDIYYAYDDQDEFQGVFFDLDLNINITNSSNVAAEHWALVTKLDPLPPGTASRHVILDASDYPTERRSLLLPPLIKTPKLITPLLSRPILPECTHTDPWGFGITIPIEHFNSASAVEVFLDAIWPANIALTCRVASQSSAGKAEPVWIRNYLNGDCLYDWHNSWTNS